MRKTISPAIVVTETLPPGLHVLDCTVSNKDLGCLCNKRVTCDRCVPYQAYAG